MGLVKISSQWLSQTSTSRKRIGLFMELGWTGGCSNLHICVSCQVWLLTYLHQIPNFVTLYMRSALFTMINWKWFLDTRHFILLVQFSQLYFIPSPPSFSVQFLGWRFIWLSLTDSIASSILKVLFWGCLCSWYSMLWSQIQHIMSSCSPQSRLGHVRYTLFKL